MIEAETGLNEENAELFLVLDVVSCFNGDGNFAGEEPTRRVRPGGTNRRNFSHASAVEASAGIAANASHYFFNQPSSSIQSANLSIQ